MSASEKLKALDVSLSEHVILAALPQIVALVEAAEKVWPPPHEGMSSNALFNEAHAALAALEEALR